MSLYKVTTRNSGDVDQEYYVHSSNSIGAGVIFDALKIKWEFDPQYGFSYPDFDHVYIETLDFVSVNS